MHQNVHYKSYIIVLLSGLRIILILLSTDRGKRQGNRIWACFILTSVKTIVQLEHLPVVGWGYLHQFLNHENAYIIENDIGR